NGMGICAVRPSKSLNKSTAFIWRIAYIQCCVPLIFTIMKTVWILMYVDNDYNQPDQAFEKLWWNCPTYEELKEYGFSKEDAENLHKPNTGGETEYWVECFTEGE